MQPAEVLRAVAAGRASASTLGLPVDEATVLHDSNKLTVRLSPCDVVARVAPADQQNAQFELDLARQLLDAGCPVAAPDPRVPPRVHERDGFVVTLWTYHEPTAAGVPPAPAYAQALARLHAGMRTLHPAAPHVTDRVDEAQRLVASPVDTPALDDAGRELLGQALARLRRRVERGDGAEQLLHGEPHPGNLLRTAQGLLFVDLETCCRGPVEFDLAHAPDDVADHYPGVDADLLRDCRLLMLAMITAWRWDRGDQLPDGRRLGEEWLGQLRSALGAQGPGALG